MAEITLGDLLAWESRLRLARGFAPPEKDADRTAVWAGSVSDRELTWAVAARASAPMLPTLRGGELVLLAHRILAETGVAIAPLLRELALHGAAGVVLEAEAVPPGLRAVGAPLPVLVIAVGPMALDLESDLNRLLTEKRGELYRRGTDIGRLLAGLTTAGADVGQILAAASEALALPSAVLDAKGSRLAAAGTSTALEETGRSPYRGQHAESGAARHEVRLAGGETLILGPVEAGTLALVRLAGERVAVAVEAALTRAAQTRPRGPARATALASFLTQPKSQTSVDRHAQALALGLSSEARYRVALGAPALGLTGLQRVLAPLGTVHDASTVDGAVAVIVDLRVSTGSERPPAAAWQPVPASDGVAPRGARSHPWLALSSAVAGIGALHEATRQARYVARLLERDALRGPVARFDVLPDLGAYRLLYGYWGREELSLFVEQALGDLLAGDRRGVLRRTLRAYLETGGSHVEAALRLDIHRNTLAYRLKQIAATTGQDPSDPGKRLALHLALLAAELPPAPD